MGDLSEKYFFCKNACNGKPCQNENIFFKMKISRLAEACINQSGGMKKTN
jgi:hypothetical protein